MSLSSTGFGKAAPNEIQLSPPHDHPRLTPGFVLKRIGEMEMLGASARFADGPTEAAMLAAALLFQRYKELHGDEE